MTSASEAQETVRLYAAGSLRAAMTEIGTAFTKYQGLGSNRRQVARLESQ